MIQKAKSQKSWRKRILIGGLSLFTLYLCFGIWVVPAIMVSQIESIGSDALRREVRVERASFNPFFFEAKIYGLKIAGAEGEANDLLNIEKVSANVQLSSVFGVIRLKSIKVSNGDVWVEKQGSGRMSFQDVLDGFSAEPQEVVENETEVLFPVQVSELLIEGFQFHFSDASLATPYGEGLRIESFLGHDIGTVEKSRSDNADTNSSFYHWDFLGKLSLQSGGKVDLSGGATSLAPWAFDVKVALSDFAIESVQPYVDEAMVASVRGILGFDIESQISIQDAGPLVRAGGSLGLDGFSVSDAEQTFAAFDRFAIEGLEADLSALTFSVASVSMESPRGSAIVQEDGALRLPALRGTGGVGVSASTASDAMEFSAQIASVVVSNGRFDLEDRSVAPAFKTVIEGFNLELSDLSAKQDGDAYDAAGKLGLAMSVLGGEIQLNAQLSSLGGAATSALTVKDLQLALLQPYVSAYANADLKSGSLSLGMEARVENMDTLTATGSVSLADLKLNEQGKDREFVSLKRFSLEGIDFSSAALRLERIVLEEPLLTVWQSDDGLNLSRIEKVEEKVETVVEDVEEKTGIAISIGKFQLKSGGVDFVDTTLLSTHKSRISGFDVEVESISTDPGELASFSYGGTIDGSARLEGTGKVNVMDPKAYLDLKTRFRGYDLTSTSPYWETYLGRGLAKGQFEISSQYTVRDNQLDGTNDFRIDQLTLGQKVQSDRAMSLPLGFAIKLMQDPSGVISYDGLPVEGDLTDPQVKPWGLIGKAIRNLILNAVASPFKFLAGMVGGREDLDTVDFSVGSLELDENGLEKVAALQKLMKMRPGLTIEVSYRPDAEEKAYLNTQYALHLLVDPNYEVVSGMDLLIVVDEALLRERVTEEYSRLQAVLPATADTATVASGSVAPVVAVTEKKNAGIVKRLASVFGFGKESPAKEAEPIGTDLEAEEQAEQGDSTEEKVVDFQKMLEAVLSQRNQIELKDKWVADLANERIRVFKTALLADEAIDTSRVFAIGLSADEDQKAKEGALSIKLSQ